MGKRTATNENRTISTKKTVDCAQALVHTWHWVEPKKSFGGFDNSITTDKLENGTSRTTIAGGSIWVLPAQVGGESGPKHPGIRGKISGKAPFGEAKAIVGSITLKAEGKPVVRMREFTFQDRANTVGQVMPAPKPLKEIPAVGAGAAATDDKGTGRDTGGGPPKRQPRQRDPDFPPTGTDDVPECWVTAMNAGCGHYRKPRPGQDGTPYIEVAAPAGSTDTIKMRVGVNGLCPNRDQHPVFSADGAALPRGTNGLELIWTCPAPTANPPYELTVEKLIKDKDLRQYPGEMHALEAKGCIASPTGPTKLSVKVFKGVELPEKRYTLSDIPELVYFTTLVEKLNEGFKFFTDAGAIQVNLATGAVVLDAAVKEDRTSNLVFLWFKGSLSFEPLITGKHKFPIGARAMAAVARKFERGLGRFGEWIRNRRAQQLRDQRRKEQEENAIIRWGKRVGKAASQAWNNTFDAMKAWGQSILERGGASSFMSGLATFAIYAGELGRAFNPIELASKLIDDFTKLGPYVELSGTVSAKGSCERKLPTQVAPIPTNTVGLTGTLTIKVGLEAQVLGGAALSFDFNGTTSVKATGAFYADDLGFGLTDGGFEVTKGFEVYSRVTMLNGFIDTARADILDINPDDPSAGIVDRNTMNMSVGGPQDIVTEPSIDLFEELGGSKEALAWKQQGKKVLFGWR